MPTLFDLLSDKSDKDNFKKMGSGKKESAPQKPHKSKAHNNHEDSYSYEVRIPDFIAIDLETTGLNRREDRITEIGIVKYIEGKEVETFSTLINPERNIPAEITRLTGISNEMVANAPKFKEVADQVLDFIGRLAICGHQVDFDFNFLNIELEKAGYQKIRNWQIDTLSTARLILTQEEGYALGKVAKALDISLENAHRALDDARASGEIALKLLPKLGEIPPYTRKKLADFAPFSLTKKILERSVKYWDGELPDSNPDMLPKTITQKDENYILLPDTISEIFADEGTLSKHLKGFHHRDEQEKFALDVATTLNSSGITAIEAGTGTGKSLAYLIPMALWALERGERVIVSTNTKNLQDQLLHKDLPTVKKVVGKKLHCTTLKGKGNYLCLKGWNSFLQGETGALSIRERGSILPLIKWADETKTGDIEEVSGFNPIFHKEIWQLISAENKSCTQECPYFNECFMLRARKRALGSHIVVVNHALFYTDVTVGSDFVGSSGALVIDEAHQLEQSGHRMLRVEIDTKRVESFLEFSQQVLNTVLPLGKTSSNRQFTESVQELKRVIKRLRKNSEQLLEDCTNWLLAHKDEADERNGDFITKSFRDNPFRSSTGLAGYRLALSDLLHTYNLIKQTGSVEIENTISETEIRGAIDLTSQMRADVNYLTDGSTDGDIFWIEGPENKRWIKLTGTTLDISGFLDNFWKEYGRPVVMTSATLSPKSDMEYFATRVGIAEQSPMLHQYKSSFDPNNVCFVAHKDAPDPADKTFALFIANELEAIQQKFQKNILVLFTNNMFLKSVYDELSDRQEHGKSKVFAQGISGNRTWIQQQMSEVQGGILLGSGAFWEGVDIPGDACEIVVIPKLPFPVPSHPLQKALADEAGAHGRNGFIDYFIPEALMKFKQGAGRLIRHKDDKGVLLVYDSRMTTKAYGKKFIKLIDSELKSCSSGDEILDVMEEFFGEA